MNIQIMFSHLAMGRPVDLSVATAAPNLSRYTTEVYHLTKRVIYAFLNAFPGRASIA